MAVGAYAADPEGFSEAGIVRLYSKDGTDWNVFQQINGPAGSKGYFGNSLDLSHVGSTLAIGAASGPVYIYEFNNVTSLYGLLHTTADINAREVCLSGDGNTVGVTSLYSSRGTMIFVRDGDGFQQRGLTFTGYGGDDSGIALSYDGSIVAIGDRRWSSSRGRVVMFQWRDGNGNGSMMWVQMGSDITGDASSDNLGYLGCVSITYNGLIVAVGASGYGKDGLSWRGLVRVYNYDSNNDTWNKIGSDLLGDNSSDGFSTTALSSDGNYLAVGASTGNYDYVKLFAKIESNYEIIGERVTSGEGEVFGSSVDISADGAVVAIGDSRFSDYKGRAYLLVRNDLTNTPSLVITKEPSAVPSTSPSVAPTIAITQTPSVLPTKYPSSAPTVYLSFAPTVAITQIPSMLPTKDPSSIPSTSPTIIPSAVTTSTPSLAITKEPSAVPSTSPSFASTIAVSKTDFTLTFLSDDTIIDFNGTSSDKEIILKTLISNKVPRDSFEQTILVGTDCQFKFVDEYRDETTLVSISNDVTYDEVVGKNIKVTSNIDIDTTNIASKGTHVTDPDNKSIYSEYEEGGENMAKIEFCIRTDFGKVDFTNNDGSINESSVNFYKVKVTVTFLLQIGFTSSSVSIAEAEESKADEVGTITTELNACDCPAAAASKEDCFDTPVEYDQNDILSVCVFDSKENSVITSFKDVTLGNGQISTQVIDTDGKPTSLASVGKLNEGMGMVNTRIISAFFDVGDGNSPATVTVSGVAVISFKTAGNRKLTTVGMEGNKSMRKLQEDNETAVEDEGTFDVEVLLSDYEQVDVGGSPGFDALEYLSTLVVLAMIPILN